MKYIFGNWKMYLDTTESISLAQELAKMSVGEQITCAVFPNTLAFSQAHWILQKSPILLGGQNVAWVPKGAYTGAVSAELFKHAGATYALVGHSERRYIFNETDEAGRKKVDACLDAGIIPVVCVGETTEDRKNLKSEYRVKKQLAKIFENLPASAGGVVVAYEPVWAIGTGDACDAEEAVRMIEIIKNEIAVYYASPVPVLYGGSVDEKNANDYLSHGMIDGLLVGRASTDAGRFGAIIEQSIRYI